MSCVVVVSSKGRERRGAESKLGNLCREEINGEPGKCSRLMESSTR